MSTDDRAQITNQALATRLGVTHSAVSRLRSGARKPSTDTMRAVEREFAWPLVDQWQATLDGSYAEKFEKRLSEAGSRAA